MLRFLFLLICFNLTAITTISASPPTGVADQVQQVYKSQVGVVEATCHNDGVQVEAYLKSVNLGKGYAWCAAFVRWCFDQSGVKTSITAYSPSAQNIKNLVYHKGKFIKEPRAADVFTLYYASLKRIGHTGFFDRKINQTIFRSVEGNTNGAGSREGDGVYIKYRSFKSTYSISRWT